VRSSGIGAVAAASISLAACGSGARQDASEQGGHYTVEVQQASFPATQSLAQHAHLVITIRNADQKPIPDIAVTITDPRLGTTAQAFAYHIDSTPTQPVASQSRPTWIVDQGPNPAGCQFSCQQGGPGGGATAYSNTWALGGLKPGASATFDWAVTAIHAGAAQVHYQVAAGLNGKAVAVNANGGVPEGTFKVNISGHPEQSYVDNSGHVVVIPSH
jgi:hypothetical protein